EGLRHQVRELDVVGLEPWGIEICEVVTCNVDRIRIGRECGKGCGKSWKHQIFSLRLTLARGRRRAGCIVLPCRARRACGFGMIRLDIRPDPNHLFELAELRQL